jgi:cell division protein FtsZ
MASGGRRASMREGPLADLFRKTDDDSRPREPSAAGSPQPEATGGQPDRPEHPPSREPAAEAPTGDGQPAARARRQPATEAARRAERRGPLSARGQAQPEQDEPGHASRYEGVPTPQERLRSVFSSDIPEDMLEREIEPPREAPQVEARTWSAPQPSGVAEPVLRVVGVGGAGVNAIDRMIEADIDGIEFVAVNTDMQSLEGSAAERKVRIGNHATRGLGSGSNPELGRASALEAYDELKALLKGSDMVFITAGTGGGTGTGAGPVVARIAREVGALTVGIVTKPFGFEGARRGQQAERGVVELAAEVDTLIVIPNSRLLSVLDKTTSMVEAFRVADDVLRQGVQGISDLITLPGLINLDFADVRTIMSGAGQALLGIGMGTGERRAFDAVEHAIESPLLETSLDGARSILLSVTGGPDLSLFEVNEAAKAVTEAAHPDANIIFGAMLDEKVTDEVWVTVVATGYGDASVARSSARPRRETGRIPADREPHVRRAGRSSLADVDVPEFIPRAR